MSDRPDQPASDAEARPQRPGGALAAVAAAASTLGVAGILGGAVVFAVTGQFSKWSWIPMAAGAGLLAASMLLSPRALLAALRRRRARMGLNMAVAMILAAGIVVLVNYVSARRHHRFDFTHSKRHTLAQQTRKILKGLKQDVTLTAFYTRRGGSAQFNEMSDLLDDYRYGSDHIKARIVDFYVSPAEAQKYEITSGSVTIVESGGRREEAYGPSEQDLTTAILKVTRKEKKKVYFVIGHGEHDPDSFGPHSYGEAKRGLEAANYEVATLNLVTQSEVPGDCTVLVVAGPQNPLATQEISAIETYLDGDGTALFLLDPSPAPALADILAKWGVEPLAGTVIEPVLNIFGDASTVVVTKPGYHTITRPLTEGRASSLQFVTPRAFESDPDAPSELRVANVVQTSDQSWLESTFTGEVKKDPNEKGGPLTIALAVSTGAPAPPPGMPPPADMPKDKPRLVVIGDSDFAVDRFFRPTANGDLFLNAVNWLAQETDLIAIPPKPSEDHSVLLDTVQARKTFVLGVLAVPLAVLIAGGIVWWRRR